MLQLFSAVTAAKVALGGVGGWELDEQLSVLVAAVKSHLEGKWTPPMDSDNNVKATLGWNEQTDDHHHRRPTSLVEELK